MNFCPFHYTVFGCITGAACLYVVKLKGRKVVALFWLVMLISIPTSTAFLLYCNTQNVAGISVPYADGYVQCQESYFIKIVHTKMGLSKDPSCNWNYK